MASVVSTTQTYFTHSTLCPAFCMSRAMVITHNTTGISVTAMREVIKTQIQALQLTISNIATLRGWGGGGGGGNKFTKTHQSMISLGQFSGKGNYHRLLINQFLQRTTVYTHSNNNTNNYAKTLFQHLLECLPKL